MEYRLRQLCWLLILSLDAIWCYHSVVQDKFRALFGIYFKSIWLVQCLLRVGLVFMQGSFMFLVMAGVCFIFPLFLFWSCGLPSSASRQLTSLFFCIDFRLVSSGFIIFSSLSIVFHGVHCFVHGSHSYLSSCKCQWFLRFFLWCSSVVPWGSSMFQWFLHFL